MIGKSCVRKRSYHFVYSSNSHGSSLCISFLQTEEASATPPKKTEQTATGSIRVGLDWKCLKFNERSGFGFLTARDRTSPWQIHQIHILPRPFPVRSSSPHPKIPNSLFSLSPQKQQEGNQDDTIFEHTHTPCPRPYTFQEASWTAKPNLFTPTWKGRAETMEPDIGRELQMVSVQMKFELIWGLDAAGDGIFRGQWCK